MIEFLKKWVSPDNPNPLEQDDNLVEAVSALLLEAAIIDGDFAESERTAITKLLRKRFVIDDGDLDLLIERARHETENTVDLYGISKKHPILSISFLLFTSFFISRV